MDTDENRWYLKRHCRRHWFDNSNYELDRPFPEVKNKKRFGLIKDELLEKSWQILVRLRTKNYSYLIEDNSEDKNTKGT